MTVLLAALACLALTTQAALAAPGTQLWAKRYDGQFGDDAAQAVAASPDGSRVFVTGYSRGPTSDPAHGNIDYATLAYDASTGAQLWLMRYSAPGGRDDNPRALGVSPDGSKVFVTGYSRGSTSGYDYATLAYDASTGTQLWLTRYHRPGAEDLAEALTVSPDGSKVFVTGQSRGPPNYFDYATLAYDASTGAQLWLKRYDGPGHRFDAADALGVSPGGGKVFVTGGRCSSPGEASE